MDSLKGIGSKKISLKRYCEARSKLLLSCSVLTDYFASLVMTVVCHPERSRSAYTFKLIEGLF
jgi:hypothetical protein